MRLIEAKSRTVITRDQYLEYRARGVQDSDEIGLNDQSPVDPTPDDIDFQGMQGVDAAAGVLENDMATVGNVPIRVAKISFDHTDQGAIPVLVTTVPCLLLSCLLVNSEEFDGQMDFGVSASHSKFLADTQFNKTVETEPDPRQIGAYVAGSTTLNIYLGAGTMGVGEFYLVYIRLP